MSFHEWRRQSNLYWTTCSRRHQGCGRSLGRLDAAFALPPNGKRQKWYYLCPDCAQKLGLGRLG